MRPLLIAALSASFLLAGCTSDGDGGDGSTPQGEPVIVRGDSLGEWTESFDGEALVGVESIDSDLNSNCNTVPTSVGSHPFTIPAADADGVAWRAKALTTTLTPTSSAPGELDIYLFDAEGNELGSNNQNDLMGEDPYTLTVSNVSPGDYTLEIHACTPSTEYMVDIVGNMVATEDVYA